MKLKTSSGRLMSLLIIPISFFAHVILQKLQQLKKLYKWLIVWRYIITSLVFCHLLLYLQLNLRMNWPRSRL